MPALRTPGGTVRRPTTWARYPPSSARFRPWSSCGRPSTSTWRLVGSRHHRHGGPHRLRWRAEIVKGSIWHSCGWWPVGRRMGRQVTGRRRKSIARRSDHAAGRAAPRGKFGLPRRPVYRRRGQAWPGMVWVGTSTARREPLRHHTSSWWTTDASVGNRVAWAGARASSAPRPTRRQPCWGSASLTT